MKLLVIGLGQCGCRVADQFAALNNRAHAQRKIEIVTGVFAVNTDTADLSGLSYIRSDYQHRILVGRRKTGGHGVGKVNELGAEIARDDGDKIIDAIRTAKRFFESDAFMLIAGAGGGTGSGSISVISKIIKDRYGEKPLYDLVVLPFEHEEHTEQRTFYNTATCLKSCSAVADAVILVDNQRYVKKDFSLRNNLTRINSLIAEPFYNLLCAGEEKKVKYIGAKTVDAGDILQTISGWTVIGSGRAELPVFKMPFTDSRDFKKKSTEIHRGIYAMDQAISELSLRCNPVDAGRVLYIVSAPPKEMNMDMMKELGDYVRNLSPKAVIRNGDYPRERGALEVTVVLSELADVEKVRQYYAKSTSLMPELKRRAEETASRLGDMDDASKEIPSLL